MWLTCHQGFESQTEVKAREVSLRKLFPLRYPKLPSLTTMARALLIHFAGPWGAEHRGWMTSPG